MLDTEGVLQLSFAVGASHCALAQVAVLLMVILAGQAVKTGLTVSVKQGFVAVTLTINEHVVLLPFASVAVYMIAVEPIFKHAPEM